MARPQVSIKKEQPIITVESLQYGALIKEKVQEWKDSFLRKGAIRKVSHLYSIAEDTEE